MTVLSQLASVLRCNRSFSITSYSSVRIRGGRYNAHEMLLVSSSFDALDPKLSELDVKGRLIEITCKQ